MSLLITEDLKDGLVDLFINKENTFTFSYSLLVQNIVFWSV